MNCPKCGNEVRPNSRFCHVCGSPIDIVNPERGGNFIRIAFVLVGILPAVTVVFEVVTAILTKRFVLLTMYDLLLAVGLLAFFALIYRGNQWAIFPVGLILVITNLLKVVFMFKLFSFSAFSIVGLLFSVVYIAFGIFLMRSKDVLAFVKSRAKAAG